MNHFIKKVLIFLIPLALFYSFPVVVIFLTKEYYTVSDVVKEQNTHKEILFGNIYNTGSFIPYKKMLFDTREVNLFALGSSRTLQIRKEFFNSPEKFINVGLAGKSLSDMKYFVKNTSYSTTTKTLILVLDREMLLKDPGTSDPTEDSYISAFGFRFNMPLQVARGIYLDYFLRHKYSLSKLISSDKSNTIGMLAFADGNGFRSDGSYINNRESKVVGLSDQVLKEANTVAQEIIKQQSKSNELEDDNIKENIKTLKEVLAEAKNKNITVVGLTPPYLSVIRSATLDMNTNLGKRNQKTDKEVESAFKEQDYSFYDLSDVTKYGGKETEFIDTIHGTDLLYAKMFIYLSQKDAALKSYVNITEINKLINESKGSFLAR